MPSRIRLLLHTVLFSLCFGLSCCGFHLRGLTSFPPSVQSVSIINQAANYSLPVMIKQQFASYGITVNEARKAPYLLILEKDESQQQIMSVGASTTPRQYQLTYTLFYSFLKAGKPGIVLPTSAITVTRQLTVNNDRILGSNFEELTLYKEMRQEATVQLLQRIGQQLAYYDH